MCSWPELISVFSSKCLQRDHWKLSGDVEAANQIQILHLISATVWVDGSPLQFARICFVCDVKKWCPYRRRDEWTGFVVMNPLGVNLFIIGFSVMPFVMYSWSIFPVCFGSQTPRLPPFLLRAADVRENENMHGLSWTILPIWWNVGCVLTDGCVIHGYCPWSRSILVPACGKEPCIMRSIEVDVTLQSLGLLQCTATDGEASLSILDCNEKEDRASCNTRWCHPIHMHGP
jgi:hypothetical protein